MQNDVEIALVNDYAAMFLGELQWGHVQNDVEMIQQKLTEAGFPLASMGPRAK